MGGIPAAAARPAATGLRPRLASVSPQKARQLVPATTRRGLRLAGCRRAARQCHHQLGHLRMTIGRQLGVGSCLLLSLSVAGVAGTVAVGRLGWIDLAHAQPPPSDQEKKKQQQKGTAPPSPKAAPQAPPKAAPPPPQPPRAAPPPPPRATIPPPPPKAPPPPPKAFAPPPPPPAGQPPVLRQTTPAPSVPSDVPKAGPRLPDGKKDPGKPIAPGRA